MRGKAANTISIQYLLWWAKRGTKCRQLLACNDTSIW